MENVVKQRLSVESGNKFIAKTFLYMFLALLLTAAVAIGVGALFTYLLPITNKSNPAASANFTAYMVLLFVSLFGMIGVSIWFSFAAIKGTHSLVVPFILYATLFGTFASSFTMFVDPVSIGIAFGISCLAFGSMALLGALIKKDINFLWIVVSGLFMGAAMMAITNLIFFLIPGTRNLCTPMYWAIEGIIFVAVMIITMVDVYNIKKIAAKGEENSNLTLFCAFNLYVDFINIFLRILALVVRIRGR